MTIIFDSSFHASHAAIPFLKPISDPNIVYSFHFYEPYLYTNQNNPELSYPGIAPKGELFKQSQHWDKTALTTLLRPINMWQIKNGIANHQIMVGEFGVNRLARGAENYLEDVINLFNANSWHWAFYSFREYGFTKYDYEMGTLKSGWKYWQAIERHQDPNHRIFHNGALLKILTDGMGKKIPVAPPAMGWNSWNWYGNNINEQIVEETISAIVNNLLKSTGYKYVVIDGGWAADQLDTAGKLVPHTQKFPRGIKRLADLAHANGLKLGIHISAGTHSCGGKPTGSFGKESLHFKQIYDWGVDFIKLDQCVIDNSEDWPEDQKRSTYKKWHDLLISSPRPIVFSMSAYQYHDWYAQFGQMGRTTIDIRPNVFGGAIFNHEYTSDFLTVMEAAHANNRHHASAGNGYWNDPDMLVVGDTNLTFAEQQTNLALWAIMGAPLMLGLDLNHIENNTRALIANRDVIAIDQDTYQQGYLVEKDDETEIWRKLLRNGDAAFVIINLGKVNQSKFTFTESDAEMVDGFFV